LTSIFSLFLGAFTELRKTAISFVMSVRPHGTTLFPLDGYLQNFKFKNFSKPVEEIQVSLKSDKNNRYFTRRRFHICDNISLNYY
jgi:hypothetical protein